jgi:hypothetical protein
MGRTLCHERRGATGIREVSGFERPYVERPSLQLSGCMLTAALTEPCHVSYIEYDSDCDPYEMEIDALKYGGCKWPRYWRAIAMEQSWGQAFIDAHIEE